jgi:hypothetical protein
MVRHDLDRMHLVTPTTAEGKVAQRSQVSSGQRTILAASTYSNHPGSSTSHPPPRTDPSQTIAGP